MSKLRRLGALSAWRDAVTGRMRGAPLSPAAVEILRRAATWEKSALDAEAQGFHESARDDMVRAAECLAGFSYGEPDTERQPDGRPRFPKTDALIEAYVRSEECRALWGLGPIGPKVPAAARPAALPAEWGAPVPGSRYRLPRAG